MRAKFERVMTIADADAQRVWVFLHDVDLLASCSEALGEVAEVSDGGPWDVNLSRRVGRFSVSAPLRVTILAESSGTFIRIHGKGMDVKLGSRLDVSATITIEELGTGIRLVLEGSYEMTGRVAALGANLIRRHAEELVAEFVSNLPTVLIDRLRMSDEA